jgi:hypothetical protein
VSLHEALEQARMQAMIKAALRAQGENPLALVDVMRDEVKNQLTETVGEGLGPHLVQIADGQIARLIGECFLDWRK